MADYVLCGDFDADGFHRPADIQACNDALTDTGARHVEVVSQVFDIPDTGFAAPPDGLIRPAANTRISCQPGARIVGVDERYPTGVNVSIFFVDQPAVTIGPGCDLDGGFADPVDCGAVTCPAGENRMGVFGSTGSAGLVVEGNTIHHTGHACIYVRNAPDRTIQGNTLYRCGSAWDSSGTAGHFPGVYVYANDSVSPTLDTKILDNFISGTQGLSLRTRGEASGQVTQGLTVTGNTIFDTQRADGSWGFCIGVGGVRELFIGENLCQNSSGVVFGNGAPDFYDSNKCDRPVPWLGCSDAVHDVLIDGLTLENIHVDGTGGAISLGSYADHVVLRNVEIRDVDKGCLHFAGRLRAFQATDLTCERAVSALRAPGDHWWPGEHGPNESIDLDGFSFASIHGPSEAVFHFPHGLEHANIANGSVTGFTRDVIRVGDEAMLRLNSFQNIDIDQLDSGHLGNAFVSDLGSPGWVCDPAGEGTSLTVLDTDGLGCASPGDAATLCVCDGAAWRSAQELKLFGVGPALRLSGDVVEGNVVQAIVARTARGNDAVLLGAMATGNSVDGVLLEDTAITSAGEVGVAALPAVAPNATCYVVTDAADSADCSSGGGSERNLCCWDGVAWNGSLGGQGPALAGSALRSTNDGANGIANIGCYRTSTASLPCHALLAPPPPVPSLASWARWLLAGLVLLLGAPRARHRSTRPRRPRP
jgi:hypothetical protein